MARAKSTPAAAQSSAIIGFEAKLWLADDNLRNNMDAAEFHTLATLRDTLLPKLLSGEFSVTADIESERSNLLSL